jgi:hypothetical protein
MSTATLPDLIEGEELDRLLASDPELAELVNTDKEVPCEIRLGWTGKLCGEPARWIIHATFICKCGGPTTRAVCESCWDKHSSGLYPFSCAACNEPIKVRMIDRLR